MISHQTLRRLVYFAAIADAGSIRGAAARLNLSVPVLSEALSDLEAELGVSLATRTTRHFELTQAGLRTQIAAQKILDVADGLTDLSEADRPLSGTLSLTISVELAGFWLPQRVKAFGERHPLVTFDIDVSDAVVDLRASKIEIAIRTEYLSPGERSRSQVTLPLVVVAKRAAELDASGAVDMALIDSRMDRKLLATSKVDGAVQPLTFSQTHQITNRSAGLQMSRAGIGAIMVMKGSVEPDIETGNLVEILPDYEFGAIDLNCHFRDRLPSRTALTFARENGLARV